MAETTNEYSDAWIEGEENHPVENAVAAAKKKADVSEKDEYITAYADLEDGKSANAEDVKKKRLDKGEMSEEDKA